MKIRTLLRAGRRYGFVLLAVGVSAGVFAADTPGGKSKKNIPYRITATDKLGVSVVGEDELTVTSRVDAKGFINLKFLGEVNVYGMTISEAQKAIETAYREGRYLRNPQVTITIEDYAPRPVTITGQVKNPNRYAMPPESPMTLVDLVSMAGGFTDSAKGTKIKITRKYPDGTIKVFEKDAESVMKGRDKNDVDDNDFFLEPNDLVFVPEKVI
jgi:polysaccharide export outer membrane protein